MARKRKALKQSQGGWRATRVLVDSTRLVQVGPESLVWDDPGYVDDEWSDAIVKLVPPPGLTGDQVASVEARLMAGGARAVRALPSTEGDRVHVDDAETPSDADSVRSLRQIAMERCRRLKNPRDRDALIELVSEALDAAE